MKSADMKWLATQVNKTGGWHSGHYPIPALVKVRVKKREFFRAFTVLSGDDNTFPVEVRMCTVDFTASASAELVVRDEAARDFIKRAGNLLEMDSRL